MLLEKNNAIVLKTYQPYTAKLIMLDNALGKIVGIPNRPMINHGAFIQYNAHKKQSHYFMQNIDIIDLPLSLAKEDILFVHHVLEICYFFIPMGSILPRLFELLVFLYKVEELFVSTRIKKLFLFQFFTALGFYPEGSAFQSAYFHQLTRISIDTLAHAPLDLMIEQELDAWLLRCIELHPCMHNFKTMHFLKKI